MLDFLFIVDEAFLRFKPAFESAGLRVQFCLDFDAALATVGRESFDYLFVDLAVERLKPLQILDWLATFVLPMRLGVFVPPGHEEEIFKVGKLGVTEFITVDQIKNETIFVDYLKELVRRQAIFRQMSEVEFVDRDGSRHVLVAADPAVRVKVEKTRLFAALKVPLLITGATGTGKSLWLKYFLSLCDPAENILVLENLQKMTASDQAALRRLVMEKPTSVMVATALPDLAYLADEGQFDIDVYGFLKQNLIALPPLARRGSDVVFFMQHFARVFVSGRNRFFSKDFCEACFDYDWPGNVAEFKTVLAAVLKQTQQQAITAQQLPPKIVARHFYKNCDVMDANVNTNYSEAKKRMLNKFNHDYIAGLLEQSSQNLTVAAEKAGMDRSNFKKIMKKYGL